MLPTDTLQQVSFIRHTYTISNKFYSTFNSVLLLTSGLLVSVPFLFALTHAPL